MGTEVKNPSRESGTPSTSEKYVGAHAATMLNSHNACATWIATIAAAGLVTSPARRNSSPVPLFFLGAVEPVADGESVEGRGGGALRATACQSAQ